MRGQFTILLYHSAVESTILIGQKVLVKSSDLKQITDLCKSIIVNYMEPSDGEQSISLL